MNFVGVRGFGLIIILNKKMSHAKAQRREGDNQISGMLRFCFMLSSN